MPPHASSRPASLAPINYPLYVCRVLAEGADSRHSYIRKHIKNSRDVSASAMAAFKGVLCESQNHLVREAARYMKHGNKSTLKLFDMRAACTQFLRDPKADKFAMARVKEYQTSIEADEKASVPSSPSSESDE